MIETLHRYPGAQPFRDDELSRRTFFGREPASVALTDQILANRLVIVYAKSGLGKTSLLNAGIAPRLREAGSVPLFVRVNDTKHGALSSVLEGVGVEAARQKLEYVAGNNNSLWSFFKTVEFWREDLLLSPVLIIDQFEELFTLQSSEEREKFLSELGYLLRGIPPPSDQGVEAGASNAPPVIRVVLSLREDFLGLLEEASDQIPEIMDHRYRLAPLSLEMASKAITGPAAIEHEEIATRAFRLEPECVNSILSYLARATGGAHGRAGNHVEPFHLQLICQHIETVAAFKQKTSGEDIVLSFGDIGGDAALSETLESFYSEAIRSLPRRFRGTVRRMCERFLISREGRRLSVEERELCRELNLSRDTLRHLVERRLLRTDRRSDSTYYELSHDALVQPVLASRRTQAFLLYGAAIFGGSITLLSAVGLILIMIAALSSEKSRDNSLYIGVAIAMGFAVLLGVGGVQWLRAGIRRRSRYGQHSSGESAEVVQKRPPLKNRLLGWVMLVTGPVFLLVWGVIGLVGLIQYSVIAIRHGRASHWIEWMRGDVHEAWQLMHDHPVLEVLWWVIEYATIVFFGWWLFRQGDRMLWPRGFIARSKTSRVDRPSSLLLALAKVLSGGVALVVAGLGFFTLVTCSSSWHGSIPYWLSWPMLSYRFSHVCGTIYQKDWEWNEINFALFFFSAFVLSLVWIVGGILDVLAALRYRRTVRGERGSRQAAVAAAVGGILIIVLLLGLTWGRTLSPGQKGTAQAHASIFHIHPPRHHFGWTVGYKATILHTEDDGQTWKSQSSGTGWLYSVTFATQREGWAVGPGGVIWNTSNGGSTWTAQTSGTKESLNAVTFVTPHLGWVAGSNGLIMHTENGGLTWQPQTSNTQNNLIGIAFVTPQSGWAVGINGTMVHTEDGGHSWKSQGSGRSEILRFIAFPTAQSGWVVGDDGIILHTEDNGRTWHQQSSGTIRNLYGVTFTTPFSGWVVGQTGIILHTEDGGHTWNQQESHSRADMTEISFVTPELGWAVNSMGVILHTEDAGRTWAVQSSGIRTDLQSVSFIKPYGVIGVLLKEESGPGQYARSIYQPRRRYWWCYTERTCRKGWAAARRRHCFCKR